MSNLNNMLKMKYYSMLNDINNYKQKNNICNISDIELNHKKLHIKFIKNYKPPAIKGGTSNKIIII